MKKNNTIIFKSLAEATALISERFAKGLHLATPLGLGKPNELLNSIYADFKAQKKSLKIFTALSLEPPTFSDELAQRFFKPIHDRLWGQDYPRLQYAKDAKADQLPKNIEVLEFYFQAGSALKSKSLQRNYQSVNYTHAAENVYRADVQVVVQLVAFQDDEKGRRYSFSCNPDMTLDVVDLYKENNKEILIMGVLHPELPFIGGDAEVSEDFFYALVDSPETKAPLYPLPRMPISIEDHMIGLYGSALIEDGGTLQIGIGSLSEALVNALLWRQNQNPQYAELIDELRKKQSEKNVGPILHTDVFSQGLYGLTEMLTDGFMHLRKAGILIREVTDDSSGEKTYVHGSFFLGSVDFYNWLREMPATEKKGLRMTRVSKVNDIYDPNELLLRRQRTKARFFNTTMQVSLLGDAMSETLPNGQVLSGVGGQYNFVAMSHELKGSRSVLMLRSTRLSSDGKYVSNIVWQPGQITIPRHLRDLVITEYGVADLRGKTDEECIKALLNITDSRFQTKLLKMAQTHGKVASDYKIPKVFQNNTPQFLRSKLIAHERKSYFSAFPLGSDFSREEQNIVLALQSLKEDKIKNKLQLLFRLVRPLKNSKGFEMELDRMDLKVVSNLKDRIYRKLLLSYLESAAQLK